MKKAVKKYQEHQSELNEKNSPNKKFVRKPVKVEEDHKIKQVNYLKRGEGIQPGMGSYEKYAKIEHEYRQKFNISNSKPDLHEDSENVQTVRVRNRQGHYEMIKLLQNDTIHSKNKGRNSDLKEQRKTTDDYYTAKQATKKLAKLIKYKEEKLKREQEQLEIEKKMRQEEEKSRHISPEQRQYNESLKKKVEEWRSQREEEEKRKHDQEQQELKRREEEDQRKQEYFSQQKQKIDQYKKELRHKNSETLDLLKSTNSAKELGMLKKLKEEEILEKIDLENEYRLPQIVRTIQMMEEEKQICERF